jgi:16S rRNA (guanine527-N7)-methyltransferase
MEILLKYFPELTALQQDQYLLLNEQVTSWNKRINLVSRKDIDQLPVHHILQSLSIALHASINPEDEVLDVGTGGGFPGLPLAIMFPRTRFTLIDSIGKKINAVSKISGSLDLRNVSCIQIRAEDYTGKVNHIVSRAVTGLGRFTAWVSENLKISKDENETILDSDTISRSGIWYLKGGDLEEELRPYPGARLIELKDNFSEAFFESKKLVWLPLSSLK